MGVVRVMYWLGMAEIISGNSFEPNSLRKLHLRAVEASGNALGGKELILCWTWSHACRVLCQHSDLGTVFSVVWYYLGKYSLPYGTA